MEDMVWIIVGLIVLVSVRLLFKLNMGADMRKCSLEYRAEVDEEQERILTNLVDKSSDSQGTRV